MFITFEGPDGSGKTTQIRALYEYLVQRGLDVVLTREPGGTSIGDQIRAVLHDVANTDMLQNTEILLYSASRAQLVGEVIWPALAQGRIVLCDRYADSTLAYQGYGHRVNLQILEAITDFATGGLKPDLTVYLDLPVAEGLRRKRAAFQAGKSELNRMDRKEIAFHERARQGYLALAAREPDRWLVIDAKRSISAIQDDIRKRVDELIARFNLTEPDRAKRRQS